MTARRMPAKRPGADRRDEMIAEAFFLHERCKKAQAAQFDPIPPWNLERYRPADGADDDCSRCGHTSEDEAGRIWCQMRKVNPRKNYVCDYWKPVKLLKASQSLTLQIVLRSDDEG